MKTGAGLAEWGTAKAVFAMDAGSLINVQTGTLVGGSGGNEEWVGNKSGLHVAAGALFHGVEANVEVDALTGDGRIQSGFNGAGYHSFTFGVANGSGSFGGVLANTPGGGHTGNFVKTGTGTQTLTGASTFTGTLTVNQGKIVLNGSLAGASTVKLNIGTQLSGHGHAGKVVVENGAKTYPGDPQILSIGSVQYMLGSTAEFSIETTGTSPHPPVAGTDYDRIALTEGTAGILDIAAGSMLRINLTADSLAWLQTHGNNPLDNYFLFTLGAGTATGAFTSLLLAEGAMVYSAAIIDGSAVFAELGLIFQIGYTGHSATNSLTGGHDVTLHVVPEPGTWAMLAVGLVGCFVMRRRMVRQAFGNR